MEFYNCRQIFWSELPPELLSSIAERLENRADIISFRRVCKTWLTSAPFSLLTSRNILSHLFPYPLSDESNEFYYPKTLVANSTFLVKSAVNPKLPPFIFTADELYPGTLSIRVPLFRYIADIPGVFPYELNLSRFEILELGRFYTFKMEGYVNDLLSCENKVVLLVNPNCETSHLTIDDCIVVELSDKAALAVTRVKSGENYKVHFKGRMFDDIVDFKGRIYAVDRKGRVCYMDYSLLKMFSIVEDPLCEGSGSDNKKLLAVSCGELYLIWCKKRGGAFEVFKLNEEEEKWDKLEGIGNDRILFVTYDGCFFASTKDFPQWRGNCIVFPRGSFPQYSGFTTLDDKIFIQLSPYDDDDDGEDGVDGHNIAVFHFEGGECKPVEMYPGYSDVFWPLPSWFWRSESLFTRGIDPEKGREEDVVKVGQGMKGTEEEKKIDVRQLCASNSGHTNCSRGHIFDEFKDQNNVDSAPAMNSPLKIVEKDVSQVKFLGVDVSSHLIPILKKI